MERPHFFAEDQSLACSHEGKGRGRVCLFAVRPEACFFLLFGWGRVFFAVRAAAVFFFAVWVGACYLFVVWPGPKPPPTQEKHAPARSPNNKKRPDNQNNTLTSFGLMVTLGGPPHPEVVVW